MAPKRLLDGQEIKPPGLFGFLVILADVDDPKVARDGLRILQGPFPGAHVTPTPDFRSALTGQKHGLFSPVTVCTRIRPHQQVRV